MSLTCLKFPLDQKLTLPNEPVAYLQCNWLGNNGKLADEEVCYYPQFAISPVKLATISNVSILTKSDDVKQKIEIILNIENFNDCLFLPGDSIGIYPNNAVSEVSDLIDCLNLQERANEPFKIEILTGTSKKNPAIPNHVPQITSVEQLLSKYLEIRAPVKKLFLRSLCAYTVDTTEKRRLEELASREGSDEYRSHILSSNITLLSLLKSFKTCKPPISILLEHLPFLKPRVYSIASSLLVDQKSLRCVVTVVENENGSRGVCSGYLYDILLKSFCIENKLERLNISDDDTLVVKVPMFFRHCSQFRNPENNSHNLILIGPGSGVAPFIGFLEHKAAIMKNSKSNEDSVIWLFYGCRNESDFIFKNDLNGFLEEGILTKLFVSFSRLSQDSDTNSPKYVQDNIIKVKEEFIDLLSDEKTKLFICGDARNMVRDVLAAIKLCFQEVKDLSESEADTKMKAFSESHKIITDSWI